MNTLPKKRNSRKKGMKPWQIALCALALLLVGVGVFFAVYLTRAQGSAPVLDTKDPTGITDQTKPGEEVNPNGVQPEVTASDRKEGVYTFLVVGLDDPGLTRNTDMLMLVSFNTVSGEVNLLQIPRDIYVTDPLMEGEGKLEGGENRICKINNVFNLAYAKKQAQDPSASADEIYNYAMDYLKDKLSNMFCMPIDFHVAFNTEMFGELLEVVCPITVEVPFDMNYDDDGQDLHIHLKAGVQELNAEQAEGFARFRQNNTDGKEDTSVSLSEGAFDRVKLQKIAISAIAKKVFSSFNVSTAQALVGSVINNINTDLSLNNCTWFVLQAFRLFESGTMNFNSIRLYELPCAVPGTASWKAMGYTQAYGFMEKNAGYTLKILNKGFNVYENLTITAEMLGYTPPYETDYYDNRDTEGQSIQEVIDNPPKVRLDR